MAPPERRGAAHRQPSAEEVDRGKRLLQSVLEFEARPCEYVRELAKELGISKTALRLARRDLGVRLVGYAWRLPDRRRPASESSKGDRRGT